MQNNFAHRIEIALGRKMLENGKAPGIDEIITEFLNKKEKRK